MKRDGPTRSSTLTPTDEGSRCTERAYVQVHDAFLRNPHLHAILALTVIFCKTPSPLQISRVLDISWEDVRQSLVSVCDLLHPPAPPEHYYSDITLSDRLRKMLSDPACPTTFVDSPRWHALLAVWCLTRSSIKYDARDIFYASDFWAEHVCSARPSQDLWNALRRSPIPCQLSSHPMLPWVITWLEEVDVDETRELTMIYRSILQETPTPFAPGLRMDVVL
ncbi:hypothetical protein MSAN_00755000 [Mycena sanguinolenta]|uniref:Uncharacterized protein n=1 Tax=Mycena sanguinolenta TaxID=230812 RepID=A0A8H6Z8K5_9AGAR|nr:hypothetical protein MSAN_00755000 [Mycena sanguinolenta]